MDSRIKWEWFDSKCPCLLLLHGADRIMLESAPDKISHLLK